MYRYLANEDGAANTHVIWGSEGWFVVRASGLLHSNDDNLNVAINASLRFAVNES